MTFWQYLLPKHLLSAWMHQIMQIKVVWFKNALINWFVKKFQVNLSQAQRENTSDYQHFNDFFTRSLKPSVREIATTSLVCPVDGKVSQLGDISTGKIITAKSQHYSLKQLLGISDKADYFANGHYLTAYLSPKDYHRIHMPCDGKLCSMTYIPGTLFSVNEQSTQNIPVLLARNERVVCYFDTEFGQIALVLVGAIFVGSMQTVWHQRITPPYGQSVKQWQYKQVNIELKKGQELGRFNMGSTIILILPRQTDNPFTQIKLNDSVQMGQAL